MKSLRDVFFRALLLAAASTPISAAEPRDIVVIDFTNMPKNKDGSRQRSYEYSFDDWSGQGGRAVDQIFRKGLLVNLAGSKGGLGENRGLDFRKHTRARIDFTVGERNRAESFAFTLIDSDGTEHSWEVSLSGLQTGAPLSTTVDLTKPAREENPGGDPGLSLPKLESWQLKGNYGEQPIEILITKVTAVSG